MACTVRLILRSVIIPALALIAGCNQSTEPESGPKYLQQPPSRTKAVYAFAVHPLHNPRLLVRAYQPLIDYLNANLQGVELELEASRDYQAFENKFRQRTPAFLLPNPWQTLEAIKAGYRVIAISGPENDFKGIFIVRRDPKIQSVEALRGKVVSFPSPTALAGAIMPQYFLQRNGIDIHGDITNRYVGSHESSIMNVYLGKSIAGATWPPPWRKFQREHPSEAAELEVAWETPPLINNSVMARDDIPETTVAEIQRLLLNLATAEGREPILRALETGRFHPGSNADYERVRVFIDRFEREVRPVEPKS